MQRAKSAVASAATTLLAVRRASSRVHSYDVCAAASVGGGEEEARVRHVCRRAVHGGGAHAHVDGRTAAHAGARRGAARRIARRSRHASGRQTSARILCCSRMCCVARWF